MKPSRSGNTLLYGMDASIETRMMPGRETDSWVCAPDTVLMYTLIMEAMAPRSPCNSKVSRCDTFAACSVFIDGLRQTLYSEPGIMPICLETATYEPPEYVLIADDR